MVLLIYSITQSWPEDERFGLTLQTRDAACAVPVNITVGYAMEDDRELKRHLNRAIGAVAKLGCLPLLARDLEMLHVADWERVEAMREEVNGMVWQLYNAARAG